MAAHCNEPELNHRYPVKTTIQSKFYPIQCVTTTYLWSNKSAEPQQRFESKGLFDMGKFPLSLTAHYRESYLMMTNKDNILIDTGATRAIVNKVFL